MIELIEYNPDAEELLARFLIDFWKVHHSEVSLQEAKQNLAEWQKDDSSLFVIYENGAAAGFVRTHNSSPEVGWIDDIFVDPSFRGRGIASQAIRLVEESLRKQGTRSFCMEVVPDNVPALRLYRRLGYDRLSLITVRKDDDAFDAVRTERIAGVELRVKKFE